MLACYPTVAPGDEETETRLLAAWLRRKRIEARLIAAEVGRLFAGEHEAGGGPVDDAATLAMLGIAVKNLDGSQTS